MSNIEVRSFITSKIEEVNSEIKWRKTLLGMPAKTIRHLEGKTKKDVKEELTRLTFTLASLNKELAEIAA